MKNTQSHSLVAPGDIDSSKRQIQIGLNSLDNTNPLALVKNLNELWKSYLENIEGSSWTEAIRISNAFSEKINTAIKDLYFDEAIEKVIEMMGIMGNASSWEEIREKYKVTIHDIFDIKNPAILLGLLALESEDNNISNEVLTMLFWLNNTVEDGTEVPSWKPVDSEEWKKISAGNLQLESITSNDITEMLTTIRSWGIDKTNFNNRGILKSLENDLPRALINFIIHFLREEHEIQLEETMKYKHIPNANNIDIDIDLEENIDTIEKWQRKEIFNGAYDISEIFLTHKDLFSELPAEIDLILDGVLNYDREVYNEIMKDIILNLKEIEIQNQTRSNLDQELGEIEYEKERFSSYYLKQRPSYDDEDGSEDADIYDTEEETMERILSGNPDYEDFDSASMYLDNDLNEIIQNLLPKQAKEIQSKIVQIGQDHNLLKKPEGKLEVETPKTEENILEEINNVDL